MIPWLSNIPSVPVPNIESVNLGFGTADDKHDLYHTSWTYDLRAIRATDLAGTTISCFTHNRLWIRVGLLLWSLNVDSRPTHWKPFRFAFLDGTVQRLMAYDCKSVKCSMQPFINLIIRSSSAHLLWRILQDSLHPTIYHVWNQSIFGDVWSIDSRCHVNSLPLFNQPLQSSFVMNCPQSSILALTLTLL
jgi:hypothetical protein